MAAKTFGGSTSSEWMAPPHRPVVVRARSLLRVYSPRLSDVESIALRGVDLVASAGEVVVIAGPSGSGKSSLLNAISLRDLPTAGQLEVLGLATTSASRRQLATARRRDIAFVAQRSSGGLWAHLTAREHLEQQAYWRSAPSVDADALLRRLDLLAQADSRPAQLSGGEQQRLVVAQALVGKPRLIVADEPTAELDTARTHVVLDAMAEAADHGAGVVLSSHDPVVLERAERVIRLHYGVVSSDSASAAERTSVIDSAGRLQLSPEVLDQFPDGRVIVRSVDNKVWLEHPASPQAPQAPQRGADS